MVAERWAQRPCSAGKRSDLYAPGPVPPLQRGRRCYAPSPMTQPDWWSGTAGVLIGTVLASAIPLWREWWRRAIERRGELWAMHTEMYLTNRALQAL